MTETASLPSSRSIQQFRGSRSTTVAPRLPNDLTLLIAIEAEATRLSPIIGLSAALANALHAGIEARARQLIEFYPRESAMLLSASSRCERWLPGFPLTLALAAFMDGLNRARSATIEFASAMFEGDTTALATAWRAAAASALRFGHQLRQELADRGIDRDGPTMDQLCEMLAHTAAGGWSGILVDGQITMPEWADQRSSTRNPVRLPGTIERNGISEPVVIRDLSTNGLGLDCEQTYKPGEIVTLHCGSEIAVRCRVVWSDQGRCGVEFLQPIGETSPLLRFLDNGPPRR